MHFFKNKMIKLNPWLFLTLIALSCDNTGDRIEITALGTWRLVQTLSDPGDGSGVFVPVQSSHTITFNNDGSLTATSNLCEIFDMSDSPSTGTYNSLTKRIIPNDCPSFTIGYALQERFLDVSYFCDEPCSLRFVRVF